jgi:hypothetical protein
MMTNCRLTVTIPAVVLMAGMPLSSGAEPAPACAPREQVVARLATVYGETHRRAVRETDDRLIELFASAETGSWTIAVTTRDGTACLVASGRGLDRRAGAGAGAGAEL